MCDHLRSTSFSQAIYWTETGWITGGHVPETILSRQKMASVFKTFFPLPFLQGYESEEICSFASVSEI